MMLTQTPGYASSSNTLATGAQGGEHSASFNDPGDCATNVNVYPIGTLIYVVVSASPYVVYPPTMHHVPLIESFFNSYPHASQSSLHMNRDFKSTSRSKTPAAPALRNPNPILTSGWACLATATKPNSVSAPAKSRSQMPLLPSSSTQRMGTMLTRRP